MQITFLSMQTRSKNILRLILIEFNYEMLMRKIALEKQQHCVIMVDCSPAWW